MMNAKPKTKFGGNKPRAVLSTRHSHHYHREQPISSVTLHSCDHLICSLASTYNNHATAAPATGITQLLPPGSFAPFWTMNFKVAEPAIDTMRASPRLPARRQLKRLLPAEDHGPGKRRCM
jgi:hypothetical protein